MFHPKGEAQDGLALFVAGNVHGQGCFSAGPRGYRLEKQIRGEIGTACCAGSPKEPPWPGIAAMKISERIKVQNEFTAKSQMPSRKGPGLPLGIGVRGLLFSKIQGTLYLTPVEKGFNWKLWNGKELGRQIGDKMPLQALVGNEPRNLPRDVGTGMNHLKILVVDDHDIIRRGLKDLLTAIASVLIGGTSIFGGRATVVGTVFGCFIIGMVEAGLVASGLTGAWVRTVQGLIFLVSIIFYMYADEPQRRRALFANLRWFGRLGGRRTSEEGGVRR